jgi:hypothetical protein
MEFRIDDIIRNQSPYFGEPVKMIVDEDSKHFYVVWGPGKYGIKDDPKYREILFKDRMKHYRLTSAIEISFLYCLGVIFIMKQDTIAWLRVKIKSLKIS